MNNVILSDIECYMKGTDEKIGSNTYKISEHLPIAIGYSWRSKDEVLSKDEVYNRSTKWLHQSGNLLGLPRAELVGLPQTPSVR